MNKHQRTIATNFAVTVLIVAAVNIAAPSPWFWGIWAVVVILGIINAVSIRRNTNGN